MLGAIPKSRQGWFCMPPAGSLRNNKPTKTGPLPVSTGVQDLVVWLGEGSPHGHLCPSCSLNSWQLPPLYPQVRGYGQVCAHGQVQTLILTHEVSATHGFTHVQGHIRTFVGPFLHYKINKNSILALTGVAQWIERQPANQRVASSIPSQGTCLGCRPRPQLVAHERQPHIDVSLPPFL